MKQMIALIVLLAVFVPMPAHAEEGDYGSRLLSKDGKWLLPVATRINGSDEAKHVGRGSVLAWDLVAPLNTPVYAMGPGKVEYAGCDNKGGYGCWLFINHGTFKAVYGHMVKGSIPVKSGQMVDVQTVIGKVGMTGMTSFGPHTHLEMQKPGGGRFRIDDFFDRSGMRFCNLCSVSGEPAVWAGATRAGGEPAKAPQPQAQAQPQVVYSANSNLQVVGLLFAILAFLFLVWFFSGNTSTVRDAAVTIAVVTLPLWAPIWFIAAGSATAAPVQAAAAPRTTESVTAAPAGAWEYAYKFASKWEGEKCTEDGAHTYAGVTQGAWNKFTKRHGLPQSDVCAALPDSKVRGLIFYEDYWLKSGADKLPTLVAIAHSDFAYNVGAGEKGAAMKTLAKCGTDVVCYIKECLRWYQQECGNCSAGHINRTKDLVAYLNSLIK